MTSSTPIRRAAVGITAAAALALPLAAAPDRDAVASPATTPVVGAAAWADDPTALSRAVLQAAQHAAPGPATLGAARTPAPQAQARPAADPAGLDAALRTLVDDGAVAVTARIETPTLVWSDAEGLRHLDRRQPARDHDRFRIASITKPMIATIVMQEVERGTWTLDTRVEDVLPGLIPGQPDVTLEHLLSHRSGMPTGTDVMVATRMVDLGSWDEFVAALDHDYTDVDHVSAALATPWHFPPGTGFSYSNAGYVVLGMLLEEVTGRDLDRLLRDRVFRPAGMPRSDYPDDAQSRGPFLAEAAYLGAQGTGGTPWARLDRFDPDVFGAAGAATSTTKDMLAFTDALLTGRLTRPETVASMMAPRSTDLLEYGLGVYRVPDPCAPPEAPAYLYGHDGGSYGTVSFALSSPDGSRSFSLAVTGRSLVGDAEAPYDLNALLVPMLLATC
ncbi:serine hydrolase domain-containing protein [Cellulomonas sp. ATA003]|uniref:serine hydrolase domain-containing protein n=1 Tax=Cellulomonas sp. ATA003 TaxID=3073064 RepID=UPI002872DEF9|nr:serine hydrolase domain-containing protein [Cellulomonas sp. ATA003]WNB84288.1 serine hydrolase domain-containing protein [Cellulomonas sp. ATA003]